MNFCHKFNYSVEYGEYDKFYDLHRIKIRLREYQNIFNNNFLGNIEFIKT